MRRKGRCVLWGARRRDLLLGRRTGIEQVLWLVPYGSRLHLWDHSSDAAWFWMPWR